MFTLIINAILGLTLVATVFAQTSAAPLFNFNTTALSGDEKSRLRDALDQARCTLSADGSVIEADGQALTDGRAHEYLSRLALPALRTADAGADVWDGGLAPADAGSAAPPARAAVAALPPRLKPSRPTAHHPAHQPVVGPTKGKKWNPIWWLKNDDDPIPPADYRPKDKSRKLMWFFRNPFHNFTFYVLGKVDKDYTVVGRKSTDILPVEGGWNWTVIRYKWVRLPYVSYSRDLKRRRFNFYLGWRPSGCFGAKLNWAKRELPTAP